MHGGRHQRPGRGHGRDNGGNIRGVERALGAERMPALQRKQHRRFESVHVLRRNRADEREGFSLHESQSRRLFADAAR